ncbi:MAG: AMP-binding protein [Deltaproteobacteria bacterium]|jgi:long-chain acyl-CoA synthetase|nr:AMP-binding protein [Deltaproteobacteria bacterium]MBW2530716.1 AMP-binding protein [Deltaproteobacteria bacterium]
MTKRKNILEWLYHWADETPDRVFMTQPMGEGDDNVEDWTFAQVLEESKRMASYLKSLDLPDKSQIAICSKNCVYWIMADYAIWMAGHVSVPIYPNLTAETVHYTLEHSESKALFVGKLDPIWDEMKKGVPDGLTQIDFPLSPAGDYESWESIVKKHDPIEKPARRAPEEMATIIYTSGSTGKPKGVMHSFGTMLTCAEGIAEVLSATPEDRYLSYLPIAHGMERWLAECVGTRVATHLYFAESIDTFVQDLQRARPTLFMSVPRLWLKFQLGVYKKMPPEKLEGLLKWPIVRGVVKRKILKNLGLDQARFAGSGSAPIPGELIAWYRNLGLELLEGYGMTENFNYSHVTMPGQSRVGYVGNPYPEVKCRISEEGEIQIKGPGTMMGYFKNEEETKKTITEDGFVRTGDRGEEDEQGRLKITGRVKEIFKSSKGKYIAPAPIENLVLNHPRVELCCVSGASFPQPHAVVMLSEDARDLVGKDRKAIEAELKEHLEAVNSQLANFENLAFFAVVPEEWMPDNGFLTPTMKIKRATIEKAYADAVSGWYEKKRPVVWHS